MGNEENADKLNSSNQPKYAVLSNKLGGGPHGYGKNSFHLISFYILLILRL